MRAFFCIPIEASVIAAIGTAAERLRADVSLRASWVRPENYHLTVRFLGEIDPMLTVDLDEVVKGIAQHRAAFPVTLDAIGAFPNAERARVLWVGGEAPRPYVELVESVNEALIPLGFERERKRPASHVTIARIKSRPDPRLGEALREMAPREPLEFLADRIVLMESVLTRSGAVYSSLCEARLGGGG
jgi:2'-5' RNA ligase